MTWIFQRPDPGSGIRLRDACGENVQVVAVVIGSNLHLWNRDVHVVLLPNLASKIPGVPSLVSWHPPCDQEEDRATEIHCELLPVARPRLLAFGGHAGQSSCVQRYDFFAERWTQLPDMTANRLLPCCVTLLDRFCFVIGGDRACSMEVYDLHRDEWRVCKGLLFSRLSFAAASISNEALLITGGKCGWDRMPWSHAARYDVHTDLWSAVRPMRQARCGHEAVHLNGQVFVFGGNASVTPDTTIESLASVEAYDPVSNLWSERAPLTTARAFFGLAVPNNLVYVVGGTVAKGSCLCSVERYDPATDAWEVLPSLPRARSHCKAVAVDNLLYVVIGDSPRSGRVAAFYDVDCFDPATNAWRPARLEGVRSLTALAVVVH